MNPFSGVFVVTQSWSTHIARKGAKLGGVDYGPPIGTNLREMPRGTPLKAGFDGVLEWVTRATGAPAWYNGGLGYAAAVRYPDGTRDIYGHCSAVAGQPGRQVKAGEVIAFSGGQKGSVGAGTSTGGHCHVHAVLRDGRTRAYPFSTQASTAGGGGTPIVPTRQPTGVPMFNIITGIDTGLQYVRGNDGRREGIQSAEHLAALMRERNGMLTPGLPIDMYWGDIIAVEWYLGRVNGPRADEASRAQIDARAEELNAKLDALGTAVGKIDLSDGHHAISLTPEEFKAIADGVAAEFAERLASH